MTTTRFSIREASEISSTILNQLAAGGNGKSRLTAMIGATNFSYSESGKTAFFFKLCKKTNYVSITLEDSDLYTVKFMRFNRKSYEIKEVELFESVYADQLAKIFTSVTGLDTHL